MNIKKVRILLKNALFIEKPSRELHDSYIRIMPNKECI